MCPPSERGLDRLTQAVCCSQSEQAGRALISYVVASSVGNVSVSDLTEPVQIEIAHLLDQVGARTRASARRSSPFGSFNESGSGFVRQAAPSPVCMFWDFSLSGECPPQMKS